MKITKILMLSSIFLSSVVVAKEEKGIDFAIQDVSFKEALNIIYSEVLNRSFMVDPVILERSEKVTFKMINEKDPHAFFKRYFDNFNIKIYTKNGVDYLKYVAPNKETKTNVKFDTLVYHPKFRGVEYLSNNVKSLIEAGNFAPEVKRKASVNTKGDKLIVYSDKEAIQMVKNVLPKIDVKPQQVIVTARIIEVKKSTNEVSGLNILLNALSNKLNLNLNVGTISNSFLNLKLSNINAIFGIIDSDTSFNVISSPVLRVLDGERGRFTVGSDVPTIAGETVNNYGVKTTNINYVSSGVIFDVEPIITDSGIKLKVRSELSDFTKTESGVDTTPTLLKRLVDSTVFMEDKSLVVLGGLSQEKNTKVEDSFFFLPASIFGTSKKFEKSDVLLLLYIEKSNDYDFIDIDKEIIKVHQKTYKDLKKIAK